MWVPSVDVLESRNRGPIQVLKPLGEKRGRYYESGIALENLKTHKRSGPIQDPFT